MIRQLLSRGFLVLLLATPACGRNEQPSLPQEGRVDTAGAVLPGFAAGDTAAAFTRDFYDWYIRHGTRSDSAIVERAGVFAPELLAALKADFDAQAADSDEVVGLDWDPFLNTQDPCSTYRVGSSNHAKPRALVPVFGTCGDTAHPQVVAELEVRDQGWRFVNFRHASDTGSLLSDLAELQREREHGKAHD